APIVWQSRERFMRFTCRKKEPSLSHSNPARMKQAGSARSREKKFLSRPPADRSGPRRNLPAGWIGRFYLRKRSKPMRCPQSCALALSAFLVGQRAEQPAEAFAASGSALSLTRSSE